MHTANLIAQTIQINEKTELPTQPIIETCCVTGGKMDCIPRKYLFSSNFVNFDLLIAPQSEFVGVDVFYTLKYKWQRCSSWYVDEVGFQRLDRQGVRKKVIGANYGNSWSGYATTSYKKHGALFTKVNNNKNAVWRFEMLNVNCSDHEKLIEIWHRLNFELRAGYPRTVLESLNCSVFLIKKLGITRWLDFEQWAKSLYQGNLYQFLCYLLPSQDELKKEGSL